MTSDVTFGIYFNSGLNNRSNIYINDSNITKISINNSDNEYYQTGIIELYNCSQQSVGDEVDIYIKNFLEFSGYIARRQIHHKAGTSLYLYQLVGKTYDLWRYVIENREFVSGTTCYIASSLVSQYCREEQSLPSPGENILSILPNINPKSGCNLSNGITFSNISVGDALVELIKYDGFKFYIDTDSRLVYYDPYIMGGQYIKVNEEDILDMSPVEECDEDIVNKIEVIGGTTYSAKTNIPPPIGISMSNISSCVIPTNRYIAQRIKAEDVTLSAVRILLGMSSIIPTEDLYFEIWDDGSTEIFDESWGGDITTNWKTSSSIKIDDAYPFGSDYNYLGLAPCSSATYYRYGHSESDSPIMFHWIAQSFLCNSFDSSDYLKLETGGSIHFTNHYGSHRRFILELRSCDSYKRPTSTIIASTNIFIVSSNCYTDYKLYKFIKPYDLTIGKYYALVAHDVDGINTDTVHLNRYWTHSDVGDPTNPGVATYSSDGGSSWTYTYPLIYNPDWNFIYKMRKYHTTGSLISNPKLSNTQYMMISISGVTSSNRVYISGTNSGSKNWKTLTNDSWYNFGFENSFSSQIKIKLSSNSTYTPKIKNIKLYTSDGTGTGGGLPVSGTKIIYSDDIYFNSSDITYPPSYSAYISYTSPKLKDDDGTDFNTNNYYWLVFHANSGSQKYYKLYYNPNSTYSNGLIAYSWAENPEGIATKWSSSATCDQVPIGSIILDVGWKEEDIRYSTTNEQSITNYGIHSKIINDPSISSYNQAVSRGNAEVYGMESIPKKGSITVNGISGLKVDYKLSSNLSKLGFGGLWEIVSFTQNIDKNGFTTTINYGKQPFDITKRISDLEKEVY